MATAAPGGNEPPRKPTSCRDKVPDDFQAETDFQNIFHRSEEGKLNIKNFFGVYDHKTKYNQKKKSYNLDVHNMQLKHLEDSVEEVEAWCFNTSETQLHVLVTPNHLWEFRFGLVDIPRTVRSVYIWLIGGGGFFARATGSEVAVFERIGYDDDRAPPPFMIMGTCETSSGSTAAPPAQLTKAQIRRRRQELGRIQLHQELVRHQQWHQQFRQQVQHQQQEIPFPQPSIESADEFQPATLVPRTPTKPPRTPTKPRPKPKPKTPTPKTSSSRLDDSRDDFEVPTFIPRVTGTSTVASATTAKPPLDYSRDADDEDEGSQELPEDRKREREDDSDEDDNGPAGKPGKKPKMN
jgi:hypothetical protein